MSFIWFLSADLFYLWISIQCSFVVFTLPVMSKFLPSINWVQLSVSKFSVYSDFSFSILQIFNKSCSDYGDNGCKGTSTELTIQPCVWRVPVANHNICISIGDTLWMAVDEYTTLTSISSLSVILPPHHTQSGLPSGRPNYFPNIS